LVEEGKVVPVGTVLVVIGGDGSEPAPPSRPAVPEAARSQHQVRGPVPDGKVRATPVVRRVAKELGVDLATVAGTGPQGRITEADVRGAATSVHLAPGP